MNNTLHLYNRDRVQVAAHRGVAGVNIPCNTIPAFDIALHGGAAILEMDLFKSLDGEIFIFHTGKEPFQLDRHIDLTRMTAEEIRKLRLINVDFNETEHGLNTFDEVLEHMKNRCILNLDRCGAFIPDVIKQVEKVLEKKLASLVNQDYTIVGGVDAIVEILNSVDRGTERHIMETLEVEEPELADEIRKKMFVFEDILSLDDRAIQRVLRDVDNSDLALALKGATEEVQNVILNNLSKRLAVMIKEDMEYMGPVRMKDVEDAQQKIVNIIRKLEDSAEIVISRGGGDEIIV
mgnify:FL=1